MIRHIYNPLQCSYSAQIFTKPHFYGDSVLIFVYHPVFSKWNINNWYQFERSPSSHVNPSPEPLGMSMTQYSSRFAGYEVSFSNSTHTSRYDCAILELGNSPHCFFLAWTTEGHEMIWSVLRFIPIYRCIQYTDTHSGRLSRCRSREYHYLIST